jgi:aspartokinase-like uncharacterized kinase
MKSKKENVRERSQKSVAIVSGGNISADVLRKITSPE